MNRAFLEEIHGIDDLICKTETEMFSDVENKPMDAEGGKRAWRDALGLTSIYRRHCAWNG